MNAWLAGWQPAAVKATLNELLNFPLMEALTGRRSRRFCLGAEIPDDACILKREIFPIRIVEKGERMTLLYSVKFTMKDYHRNHDVFHAFL